MAPRRPPLTHEQILAWADEHRSRTGKYPETYTVGRVRLYGQSTPAGMPRVSSDGVVAGRLFGQVRFDLLLQISPSVSGSRACYVLWL